MDLVSDPTTGPVPVTLDRLRDLLRLGLPIPPMAGAEDPPADPPADPPPPDDKKDGDKKDGEPETFSREYVESLRRESASYRTKYNEVDQRLKALEAEKLSDQEKKDRRLKELEEESKEKDERLQRLAVQAAVERECRKLGVVDEDAAYRLLDHGQVQVDGDGRPTNVADLLKELTKSKPWLVAKDDGNGKKGVPGTPRSGGGDPDRDTMVKETREELRATGKYQI